jgi:hypothetical protein
MKTIIETNETDLASAQFKKSNKTIAWCDLTRAEQIKVVSALAAYFKLYSQFIKEV